MNCPNCGAELNNDEKSAGVCFTCKAKFNNNTNSTLNYDISDSNTTIGNAVKVSGVVCFIAGIILDVVSLFQNPFVGFAYIMASIFLFIMLLGFSEIIRLLYVISKK